MKNKSIRDLEADVERLRAEAEATRVRAQKASDAEIEAREARRAAEEAKYAADTALSDAEIRLWQARPLTAAERRVLTNAKTKGSVADSKTAEHLRTCDFLAYKRRSYMGEPMRLVITPAGLAKLKEPTGKS